MSSVLCLLESNVCLSYKMEYRSGLIRRILEMQSMTRILKSTSDFEFTLVGKDSSNNKTYLESKHNVQMSYIQKQFGYGEE